MTQIQPGPLPFPHDHGNTAEIPSLAPVPPSRLRRLSSAAALALGAADQATRGPSERAQVRSDGSAGKNGGSGPTHIREQRDQAVQAPMSALSAP